MADESTIVFRLDRIEETLRDLGQRVVSAELYARDRAELERDIADLRRELAEEKLARRDLAAKEEVRELKAQFAAQGTNWRQAIYAGVIPGALFLVGILLQLKGGK
jgi:uroporphyrinogen-III synthase